VQLWQAPLFTENQYYGVVGPPALDAAAGLVFWPAMCYSCYNHEYVFALDKATGAVQWTLPPGGAAAALPLRALVVQPGWLCGSTGGPAADASVVCASYTQQTAAVAWSAIGLASNVVLSPDGSQVYWAAVQAGTGIGMVAAATLATGTVAWNVTLTSIGEFSTMLVADAERVYVVGYPDVTALSAGTGAVAWSSQLYVAGYQGTLLLPVALSAFGGALLIAGYNVGLAACPFGCVLSVDTGSGTLLWTQPVLLSGNLVADAQGLVYGVFADAYAPPVAYLTAWDVAVGGHPSGAGVHCAAGGHAADVAGAGGRGGRHRQGAGVRHGRQPRRRQRDAVLAVRAAVAVADTVTQRQPVAQRHRVAQSQQRQRRRRQG
jgi:hypothetical protein